MHILEKIKNYFGLKKLVLNLGSELKKQHGKSNSYNRTQIENCMNSIGIKPQFFPYGYAMILNQINFNEINFGDGKTPDYKELRKEIAAKYFEGNIKFKLKEVLNYTMKFSAYKNDPNDTCVGGGGGD